MNSAIYSGLILSWLSRNPGWHRMREIGAGIGTRERTEEKTPGWFGGWTPREWSETYAAMNELREAGKVEGNGKKTSAMRYRLRRKA